MYKYFPPLWHSMFDRFRAVIVILSFHCIGIQLYFNPHNDAVSPLENHYPTLAVGPLFKTSSPVIPTCGVPCAGFRLN